MEGQGPRPPLESEYPKVIQFLNQNLRVKSSWSIEEEYPTALNLSCRSNSRVIWVDGKVVSHAVVKPLIIKTPQMVVKVAAIGSVVTDENFRGQGYSSQIIRNCNELAQEQDCDLAILWTDIFDFYRKLGFELVGNEVRLEIRQPLKNLGHGVYKVIKGSQIDPSLIHQIYNKHTVTSYRTVADIQKLLKIPNSNVYTSWSEEGKMLAYAIEGKGEDLKDYIHEWGGDVTPLMNLFNFIYETTGAKNLNIIAPSYSQNLIQKMKQCGATASYGYLGMIKILNYQSLFNKIKKWAYSAGYKDLILEVSNSENKSSLNLNTNLSSNGIAQFIFKVGYGGFKYETTSESDISKMIFGPNRTSEIFQFNEQTTAVLNQIFPIRFWVWGWDSI